MSYVSKDFDLLIALCEVEAENFRTMFRGLEKEKGKALEKLRAEHIVTNSPAYKKAENELEAEYEKKIADLRRETAETLDVAIENAREAELIRVMNVNETILSRIRAIADIPMSKTELTALMEKYDSNNNYWASRLFLEIAEKNGISSDDIIEASYDTKMNVIDQVAFQANRVINYFPDDRREQNDSAEIRHGYLTTITLPVLREAFYGTANVVSDNNALMRFEAKLKAKNTDFEKGVVIGEFLRNTKGDKRDEALYSIALNKTVSDLAAKLSGYGVEIAEFRTGKAAKYSDAKTAMERLNKTENEERKKEIISENSGNEFFEAMLSKQQKKDKKLQDMLAVVEKTEN